ncbi:MAG: hypothetical protein H6978_07155 [Gammaproteobacteria bacterium]|nr:hypothetical protein [Gammaproteobacteria bacterium]
MNIDKALYDRVLGLAWELSDAGEKDDEAVFRKKFAELETVCADAMASDAAHPFFLETLADFTMVDEEAVQLYEEALDLAAEMGLRDDAASLYLAIAERCLELGDAEDALAYARQGHSIAQELNDAALLSEATDLVSRIEQSN